MFIQVSNPGGCKEITAPHQVCSIVWVDGIHELFEAFLSEVQVLGQTRERQAHDPVKQ